MYISEIVEINNYRNLTGKTITFNDTLNFLIGENNIGKTNIRIDKHLLGNLEICRNRFYGYHITN